MKYLGCHVCGKQTEVDDDYEEEYCCQGLSEECYCCGAPVNPIFCNTCIDKFNEYYKEE